MEPALETLLDGVIDYAGLYPPAKLDMEAAIREYVSQMEGAGSLMLNRFICPMHRLDEFGAFLERVDPDFHIGLSVTSDSPDHAQHHRDAIGVFHTRYRDRCLVEACEVKSGPDVGASLRALRPLAGVELYLEIPLGDQANEALHAIAESEIASAKARTGGLEASAFPSPDALANFLRECLDLNLSFKLTAGLHHPVRAMDTGVGAPMHGFINLLIALALAEVHDLNRAEISAILSDESPRNFVVDKSEVGWRDLRADLEAIDTMRTLFIGFGSCSVSEPIDDLKALGLW